MEKLIYILIIIFGFISTSCTVGGTGSGSGSSDGATTTTNISGAISGVVVADPGADTKSVANAQVKVESHPEITTTTDSQGHYAIENVDQGNYVLYISSAVLAGQNLTERALALYGAKIDNVIVSSKKNTTVANQTMKKTGSIAGVVDYFQNPNSIDKTGTDVYVPGTDFIVKTSSTGAFSLAGLPEGTYTIRMDHLGFQPYTLTNVVITSGNVTNVGTKYLDISKGPQGSLAIDTSDSHYVSAQPSGAEHDTFKIRTVPLKISFNADAVWMKVSDESAFLNKQLELVSNTKNWIFTSDGYKKIYVQFYDLNALPSSLYSIDFYVDTQNPIMTSITLLNGWAQTATTSIFLNSTASDTGSGIKQIMVSNISDSFNSGELWQTYTSPINWTLSTGSGNGIRNVYAKVRDFIGRESNAASASINLGSQTLVYTQKIYTEKMIFYKEQSPYLISSAVEFAGDVEFKPGSEVYIDSGALLIKGIVTAVGSGTNSITIADVNSSVCDPSVQPTSTLMDLSQGAPFVSQNSRFQNVNFNTSKTIIFNGGRVSGSNFNSQCNIPANYGGYIQKKGLDVLTITTNTFNKWGTFLDVEQGDGNTTASNNTGTIYNFYTQGGTGANSVLAMNNFSAVPGIIYHLKNNLGYTPSGNSFGSCGEVYHVDSPKNISIKATNTPSSCDSGVVTTGSGNLKVSGLTLNSCKIALNLKNVTGGSINVTHSTFNNCWVGVSQERVDMSVATFNSTVSIGSSALKVSEQLIKADSGFGNTLNVSITEGSINCTSSTLSNHCDFFYATLPSGVMATNQNYNLIFNNNYFNCVGDSSSGCRGFVFIQNAAVHQSLGLNLKLNNNLWKGSPSKIPDSSTINITTGGLISGNTPVNISDAEVKIFQFGLDGTFVDRDLSFSSGTISNTNQSTY